MSEDLGFLIKMQSKDVYLQHYLLGYGTWGDCGTFC